MWSGVCATIAKPRAIRRGVLGVRVRSAAMNGLIALILICALFNIYSALNIRMAFINKDTNATMKLPRIM